MSMRTGAAALAVAAICAVGVHGAQPRLVRIDGRRFVEAKSGAAIVLGGPNVVVKGPPYLPAVAGDTICNDVVNSACQEDGTCVSCETFNQADVDHIKARGWNFIRLGVMWAGAQPRDEDALDPAFLDRLHAILNLTDRNGLHVMLDNHGDMVGGAGCGNGLPLWFQKQAAPGLIGTQPTTGFPYNLIKELNIAHQGGYEVCDGNASAWAEHADDPNYNILNRCCQALNGGGNPPGTGFTHISQRSMDYLLLPGPGRDAFVRYWRLMAAAVADHPSAFAAELMNEPMSIRRKDMFNTWKACADAITEVVPDMSVAVADIGEGGVLPAWVTKLTGGHEFIDGDVVAWMKESNTAFMAWHYGAAASSVANMLAVTERWGIPTFGTELQCSQFNAAAAANISHSYWHYSSYCTTGPAFGNRVPVVDTFGACILGWAGGDSTKRDCV
eukprot:TRINITY_DN27772_c0_g1_i1.p1 TRINITY_DN27772_c0_g1~~TRINITY_DN27772_c0_g1_i1.p1  ORF type:complete len:443 (+),score=152.80 TRINITY_DN27772_c0_g1_i1:57-1385(+)